MLADLPWPKDTRGAQERPSRGHKICALKVNEAEMITKEGEEKSRSIHHT